MKIESSVGMNVITIDEVHTSIVPSLVREGADISNNPLRRNPLWWTVNRGNQYTVKRLYEAVISRDNGQVGGRSVILLLVNPKWVRCMTIQLLAHKVTISFR